MIDYLAIGVAVAALLLAGLSAWFTHKRWKIEIRVTREAGRLEFFRDLSGNILAHNWKLIEHWDHPGVRPGLTSTTSSEGSRFAFGKRIVHLDHFNLLWQVFLHKDDLEPDDLEGFKDWAQSWCEDAIPTMRVIFETGDLYPLDFIEWLWGGGVIPPDLFKEVMGDSLKTRLQDRRTTLRLRKPWRLFKIRIPTIRAGGEAE